jgi:hypothetical protein
MKDTKRALRRHHRQRMIARALRVVYVYMGMEASDSATQDWVRRNHDHLKVCSCWMCGNRRKWGGPTIQERRWEQGAAADGDD